MKSCGTVRKARQVGRKPRPEAEPLTPQAPPPSSILHRRSTRLGLLAVFALSFGIYAFTSARTVTGEDSGELISAAYTLGVAHPPGYPTWCLLAKLATLIPIGEVGFRVALLSAFFGALTITSIAAILLLLTQAWVPAIAASFAFGFLRDQWSQATIAEVYTLNTFFLAICMLLLLLWAEKKSWGLFYTFAFVYGLSLTNHLTMLGAAPAFLLFMLIKGWRLLRRWPRVLLGIPCFVAGLIPYAYLPIAASRNPDINWGAPTTIQGVIEHVMRRQYLDAETLPDRSWSRFGDELSLMGKAFAEQGGTALLVLGLLSLVLIARRRFTLFLVLFGVAAFSSIGFILQTNVSTDFESAYASRLFHVPAWMMLLIAGGVGIAEVLRRLPRRVSAFAGAVVIGLSVAPPLVANFKTCDYSSYRIVAAHGRRLLMSLPGRAVVFPSSDHNTFPLLYLKNIEGLRPDVTIADKYGYIEPAIVHAAPFSVGVHEKTLRSTPFRQAIEAWVVETWERPVFFSNKGKGPAGFELLSEGLWYRARHASTTRDQVRAADDAAWESVEATPIDDPPSPYDYTARMVLSDLAFAKARRLLAAGPVEAAVAQCRIASAHVPESKEIQNNLGSLLAEAGAFGPAREFFGRAVGIDAEYVTAVRNYATSLRAAGALPEAKAQYLRLLELSPLDPFANRALAEIAKSEGSWSVAALHLEEVGKVENDPAAYRDAGLIALLELNDLKRAKRLLRISLAIDPNQPEIREVEEEIKPTKASGDENKKSGEQATPTGPDDPDDHSKHDCRARGCEARKAAQKLTGLSDVPTPTPPNPLSQVMPKVGMPEQRPGAQRPSPTPSIPQGRTRQ